jgi:hypothetical protein
VLNPSGKDSYLANKNISFLFLVPKGTYAMIGTKMIFYDKNEVINTYINYLIIEYYS